MSVWSDAFDAAYDITPDFSPLADLLTIRSGKSVEPEWVSATIDEAFVHVMQYAPCKQSEWEVPTDLPERVQAVLGSVLTRVAGNPEGIRTVQMGEFSQTWAGTVTGPGDLITGVEQRIIGAAAGCPSGGIVSVPTEPTTVLSLYPRG